MKVIVELKLDQKKQQLVTRIDKYEGYVCGLLWIDCLFSWDILENKAQN